MKQNLDFDANTRIDLFDDLDQLGAKHGTIGITYMLAKSA